ncbi:MAG: hypothetical protein OH319_00035 [Candidatus Parvarchaeota archaeon]|nr:hypothetical protein [Candidatus Jingweiarchaeum tengchongense]MCW1298462.1 hypothetical protein [Candidatus Jingweiarchaeum tengchongense]MCW1300554.1 hypothetical protein [Candidatus Jingweiarchaeum tengchongense]MCW1304971.1 hypothetical protein [Candidatus Jingweiarchaeum tengchongense]MCW1309304.1 hypothetical protein [Candidatus Jingweiarchaeum tengchongense]
MGVVDIIIATAIFSFFFLYALFFINSVQVEFRSPTSLVIDNIFENLKTEVLRIPIKIKSNYTLIWEVAEIELKWIDKNSTVVKIGQQVIPSQFLEDELIFPLNSSDFDINIYFVNGTNRSRASYSTDLSFLEFSQYFKISNSFYDANLQKNCTLNNISSYGFNVFSDGINTDETITEEVVDNVSVKISCTNISYNFFSYSPKIKVMTRKSITIGLKPNFTNWETESSSSTITGDLNLLVKKILLYNTSLRLLFLEFMDITNVTIHPETGKISLIINEPSNFSIYVVNFSNENRNYYKNRELDITVGAIEKNIALVNESITSFMLEDYNLLKNKFGYNFFVEVLIDGNLAGIKGTYLSEVKRLGERNIFYYDDKYDKKLALVRIGIW